MRKIKSIIKKLEEEIDEIYKTFIHYDTIIYLKIFQFILYGCTNRLAGVKIVLKRI